MIVLPTQGRLERRRANLYSYLQSILHNASVTRVENIIRKIHLINFRLHVSYANIARQEKELFINQEEEIDYDIQTKDPTSAEVSPTAEELAKIEAQITAREI